MPKIGINGNRIHVVWMDDRDDPYHLRTDVYYIRSLDNGYNFDLEKKLADGQGQPFYTPPNPNIAVNGDNLHVVFERYDELYYLGGGNNGDTWDTYETSLTSGFVGAGFPLAQTFPDIAASGDNLHVVWHDGRDMTWSEPEIYYKKSTDNGDNWDADIRLTDATGRSFIAYPRHSIAAFGRDVHIVWYDERDGNFEIYYEYRYE
jgi:hypothetical protein